MSRRIVVTGIGVITAYGVGKDALFDGLLAGRACHREIPAAFARGYQFRSRFYVPFPEFRLSDVVETPFEQAMERTSHLAVAATHLAMQDAGRPALDAAAVILGVGINPLRTAFQSHLAHLGAPGGGRFNRMVIPMTMPNAAAAWVSILFGSRGPAYTVNASCASGTYAIGEAYGRIARGENDIAVAGGVECLADPSGSIMRGFDGLGALTAAPDGWPRPFTNGRSGFLFSEGGGAVLILEEREQACRRGAPIYAEIAGFASGSDAGGILQMEESGASVVALLRRLVGEERPDYLNAHGTGTRTNDETEARAIREVFGGADRQPLINATKGFLGHAIGASGAIEAAVTALSVKAGKIHGNLLADPPVNPSADSSADPSGDPSADPSADSSANPLADLNLARATTELPIRSAVSLSFGFGGHNAGLLFRATEPA